MAINKLLVAVDGSQKSKEALERAVEIAEGMRSEIELIHVIEPVRLPATMYPMAGAAGVASPTWVSQYYESYREENEKMLQEIFEMIKTKHPKLVIEKKLVDGIAATEIVKEAKSGDFDLIVVGAQGLGFLDELILGSTSKNVVDKSDRPVLVVK